MDMVYIDGMVSIVMPSYNSERFIAESIRSVIAQTCDNWELIIVDDCSSDMTVEVAQSFAKADSRIKVLVNEMNSGAAQSRNRALREARGEWIAFLDSDDLWDREKLRLQLGFMEKTGAAFSYTQYRTIDEDGLATGKVFFGPARISEKGMRRFCWPGCLTVMYRRPDVGLIQIADLKKHNDYAMWIKASKKADCVLLPETLASYRLRRSSISHGIGLKTQISHLYGLWRVGEADGRVQAVLNTTRNVVFGVYKKMRYVHRANSNHIKFER